MTVPGWPEVFRGTAAVAAGLVTPDQLRGPQYERILPDTYVRVDGRRPDLRVRSRAAYHWAGPDAVLCGYSAAELLDRSCAPWHAPAEVVVTAGRAGAVEAGGHRAARRPAPG